MRRRAMFVFGVGLSALLVAGCADILGLDPLGPAVRSGDEENAQLPDASTEAAADASDQ